MADQKDKDEKSLVEQGPWDSPAKPQVLGATLPKLVSSTGRFGDTVIFLFFAAIGILCELVAHAYTKDTLFIIAGPVVTLLLYVATALLYRRFRLRFDQLGDNCYYLGFLFTLTALSIALYDFKGLQVEISTIVSNFGVALASTILGVLLRVVFAQMREDPIEVEEQSRYELAQASRELKEELYASVQDMKSFRGLLQQSIAESFDEVNEKSKESILRAAQELSEAARNINREIAARNEQIGERFDRFNDLTQRSVSSLEALVESMERVRPPNELIHEAFEKTVRSMERMSEESQKIHRITEQQRESTQGSIDAAASAIQRISEDLNKLTGDGSPLGSVIENLTKTSSGLDGVGKDIERLSQNLAREVTAQKDRLGEINSATSESVQVMKSHNAALSEALNHNRVMLSEIEKNLAEMARALVKAVG
jgi:methyl-accepting chemotaxis protein